MDYIGFLEELKKDTLPGVLLLCGSEEYLRAKVLQEITTKYAGEMPMLNSVVFEDTFTPDDVCCAAEQLPLMAEKRIIIVRDCPQLATGKGEKSADSYLKYLSNPATTSIIIFHTAVPDKRTSLYQAINKAKGVCTCDTPDAAMLTKWMAKQCAAQGKKLDRDAAEELLQRVGTGMMALSGELEKLIAYAGETGGITLAMVEEVATVNTEYNVFRMVDKLMAGDVEGSLALAQSLLHNGEKAAGIISLAMNSYHNLLLIKNMQQAHLPMPEMKKRISLPDFVIGKYQKQATRLGTDALNKSFRVLLKADANIKTGQVQQEIALQIAIMKLCRAAVGK